MIRRVRRRWLRSACLLGLPFLVAFRWPQEINRLCSRAREAFGAGRLDEAARSWEEAGRGAADSPEIAYNLGTTYLAQRDWGRAIETLGRALELTRSDPLRNRMHYNRGNAFFRLDQIEAAATDYRKALEADPTDEDAAYNLALCEELLRRRPPQAGKQDREGARGGGLGKDREKGKEQVGPEGSRGPSQERAPARESLDGRRAGGEAGGRLNEADVDRVLRELELDERQLRGYFQPRASVLGRPEGPFGSTLGLEEQLKEMTGESSERDW